MNASLGRRTSFDAIWCVQVISLPYTFEVFFYVSMRDRDRDREIVIIVFIPLQWQPQQDLSPLWNTFANIDRRPTSDPSSLISRSPKISLTFLTKSDFHSRDISLPLQVRNSHLCVITYNNELTNILGKTAKPYFKIISYLFIELDGY